MKFLKLAALALILTGCEQPQPMWEDGALEGGAVNLDSVIKQRREYFRPTLPEVEEVRAKIRWFDSVREMREVLKAGGCENCGHLLAASLCKRNEPGIADCVIYVPRPKYVDDQATLSLGHEILHGTHGDFHRNSRVN
jgi:hypothetical protein